MEREKRNAERGNGKNANAACVSRSVEGDDKLQDRQIIGTTNSFVCLVDEMLLREAGEREKVVMQSVGESELSSISNDTK
jgi:hypothetical protein